MNISQNKSYVVKKLIVKKSKFKYLIAKYCLINFFVILKFKIQKFNEVNEDMWEIMSFISDFKKFIISVTPIHIP